MDLPSRMRIVYNLKHRYVVCLKFVNKLSTYLAKEMFQVKVSIRSTIKKTILILSQVFGKSVVVTI